MRIENETMQDHISRIETAASGLGDFPQVQALLSLSAREAGRAEALGLLAGQPALRIRIETMGQGAADLAELAGAGLGTDSLADGAAGLHKLATSLVQELRGLLAAAVQERTAAIAIAAENVPDAGPVDLTAEMKVMAAMPAPVRSDRPGIVVDAGPWDEHAYGRVSGDFLMGGIKPTGVDGVAPEKSISIPAAMMVRMKPGEKFVIHSRGYRTGENRAGAPDEGPQEIFIIPLHEGVDVHGPAVITVREVIDPEHVNNLQEDMRAWLSLHERSQAIDNLQDGTDIVGMACVFGGCVLGSIAAITTWTDEISLGLTAAMMVGGVTPGFLIMGAGNLITRRKKAKLKRQEHIPLLERVRRGVPYCFRDHGFPENWSPAKASLTIPEDALDSIRRIKRVTEGLNFRPYRKMWTVDGNARILKPLPALPAPDNVTPLDLGAARRKVTA